MCSSTLSVNCEKAEKATQRYPDCRSPYFAAVAGLWSAPGYPRERGDSQEGGNRRCLPSCAPARRQRTFPRSAERNSPLDTSEKPPRPLGANTLTQFAYPARSVLKKTAARIGRTGLRSSSTPLSRCREKGCRLSGRTRPRGSCSPLPLRR